ncbi:MAG: DUF1223 domain-containing protein [Alphaproteobacteria bacterium]
MRRLFALGCLALVLALPPASAAERAPVLVELFTSEGCSSCPPADAYLGELARRPGVIALSFHVDYWNRLGWTDPFSSAAATARQKGYAESLKQSYVYTPEMVVDGRVHEAGSRREKMEALIGAARANAVFPVALARTAGGIDVTLPAAGDVTTNATVWLVLYDRSQTVAVKAGENGGRSITHANVVREIRRAGSWNGQAARLALPIDAAAARERGGAAVIVQAGSYGTVLGAGAIALDGPGA